MRGLGGQMEHLDIHAVDQCNFSCKGCSHFAPFKKRRTYQPEDYLDSIKKIQEWDGIEWLTILGGEPTLHPDIIGFVNAFKSFPWKIRFITNGQFVEHRPKLMTELRKICDNIWVTVHPQLKLTNPNLLRVADLVHWSPQWRKIETVNDPHPRNKCDWGNCYALHRMIIYIVVP